MGQESHETLWLRDSPNRRHRAGLDPPESFGGLAGQTDWKQTVNRQVELMPKSSTVLLRVGLMLVWFAPFFMGYGRFLEGSTAHGGSSAWSGCSACVTTGSARSCSS